MRNKYMIILVSLLTGCNSASDRITPLQYGNTKVLATTGSLRLVTSRARVQPNGAALDTVCTEPSPDYAIAYGKTAALSGSVTLANGDKGDVNASGATTEAVTALAGRTAGVLALRDGLYAACQSYANGVIGHDAYAMILSQYGDLLVSLAGGSSTDTTTGNKGTAAAVLDPMKKQTLAALLVACIGEHDPTRGFNSRGAIPGNALLSVRFCQQVLSGALKVSTSK